MMGFHEASFGECDQCGNTIDIDKCTVVMQSKGEPSHFYFCDDDCEESFDYNQPKGTYEQ